MTITLASSEIVVRLKPKLKKPVLVIGLPGIGLVSKLAADNLVKTTNAKKFASIYSPHFPNQVVALKNGKLRLFAIHFYSARVGKQDLVILKGDLQPLTVEGQYEVCAKVLSYAKTLGVTKVVAMAGYAINSMPPKPRVFATTTDQTFLKELLKLGAVLSPNAVPIVGLAGMLPGLSRLFGLKGACLLVETPGPIADGNGAKTLSDLLAKMFGGKIDTSKLAAHATKAGKMLSKLEKAEAAGGAPAEQPQLPKSDLSYIR